MKRIEFAALYHNKTWDIRYTEAVPDHLESEKDLREWAEANLDATGVSMFVVWWRGDRL